MPHCLDNHPDLGNLLSCFEKAISLDCYKPAHELSQHPHSLLPGQPESLHLPPQTGLHREWHSTLRDDPKLGSAAHHHCAQTHRALAVLNCGRHRVCGMELCAGNLDQASSVGASLLPIKWLQYISHCQIKADKSSKWWTKPIRESEREKEKKTWRKNAESTSILFRKLSYCQRKQKNSNKSQRWLPSSVLAPNRWGGSRWDQGAAKCVQAAFASLPFSMIYFWDFTIGAGK